MFSARELEVYMNMNPADAKRTIKQSAVRP